MPTFSQRLGVREMPRQLQLGEMDADLRNSLWNALFARFGGPMGGWIEAAEYLAKFLFKEPVDLVPTSENGSRAWIREKFFASSWAETYDMVEFLVVNVDTIKRPHPSTGYQIYYSDQRAQFLEEINYILQRELSGYRFVAGVLAPIVDSEEVAAVNAASQYAGQGSLSGASTHIRAALGLLGQKPTPDYRNSIKESASAVEAAVNVLAGTEPGGVAKAIERISGEMQIHPAMQAAFKQLYGFSSDADGVRHAIMDQPNVGFAEAKFMLVACSAFVNFLFDKMRDSLQR